MCDRMDNQPRVRLGKKAGDETVSLSQRARVPTDPGKLVLHVDEKKGQGR